MNTSENVQEIAKAIAAAQAEFKSVGMSGENKFDRYTYAKLEDYVSVIKRVLPTHGLSIITSVDETISLPDRTTKNGGTEHAVRVKLTVRLMHTSGEWVESFCWGEGQDRADKAVYKAITGARKYALASALGLATSDDPEADENVGTAPAPVAARQPQRRPAPVVQAATPQQVEELQVLMESVGTPIETAEKWLKAANVASFDRMPTDKIAKCIQSLKQKSAKQAA